MRRIDVGRAKAIVAMLPRGSLAAATATICLSLLVGCGGVSDTPGLDFGFPTGEFNVRSTSVTDDCLGGALNVLFMPQGKDTPHEWSYPVTVYDPGELPQSYQLRLREPFGSMKVDVSSLGSADQQFVGVGNQGVLLDEALYGACTADMDALIDVHLVDRDRITGAGYLSMANVHGDDRCPREVAEPCSVYLTLDGARATQQGEADQP